MNRPDCRVQAVLSQESKSDPFQPESHAAGVSRGSIRQADIQVSPEEILVVVV